MHSFHVYLVLPAQTLPPGLGHNRQAVNTYLRIASLPLQGQVPTGSAQLSKRTRCACGRGWGTCPPRKGRAENCLCNATSGGIVHRCDMVLGWYAPGWTSYQTPVIYRVIFHYPERLLIIYNGRYSFQMSSSCWTVLMSKEMSEAAKRGGSDPCPAEISDNRESPSECPRHLPDAVRSLWSVV